jgi:hypothetical protein
MNILQHRAAVAMAKITAARTPQERHEARQEGVAVKADLEQHIADENFKTAFKAAKPQSMVGAWKDNTVRDAPVFMTGPAETRITRPVKLPDGTMAAPNPQGQIVVPASMAAEMTRRGYFRANSVITALGEKFPMSDPPIPNGT